MIAAGPPTLYIGHDHTMAVVATLPLQVEGGRATTYQWGKVAETFAGPPSFVGQFFTGRSQPVIIAPWIGHLANRHCLLVAPQERRTLATAIEFARRITRTLPALAEMVDEGGAHQWLAQALFDLAKVLERRQEIRELHNELHRHRTSSLPASSPTVHKLLAQRDQLARTMADLDTDIHRRISELATTATAGEAFIHERQLNDTLNQIDHTLATMPPTTPTHLDTGTHLPERIKAVLEAYRELNDRYGTGS